MGLCDGVDHRGKKKREVRIHTVLALLDNLLPGEGDQSQNGKICADAEMHDGVEYRRSNGQGDVEKQTKEPFSDDHR